jgi:hypothetical protein
MSRQIWRSKLGEMSRPACHRDGRDSAVGVPKLFVRAALADFDEPEPLKAGDYFARLEDGDGPHGAIGLRHEDGLRPHKLGLEWGLAVLQEHGNYLAEVGVQLVEAVPLAARPGEPRDVAHEDARLRVAFDHSGVSAHRG